MLVRAFANKNPFLSTDTYAIKESKNVIITIGTTLNEHGGPKLSVIENIINQYFNVFEGASF